MVLGCHRVAILTVWKVSILFLLTAPDYGSSCPCPNCLLEQLLVKPTEPLGMLPMTLSQPRPLTYLLGKVTKSGLSFLCCFLVVLLLSLFTVLPFKGPALLPIIRQAGAASGVVPVIICNGVPLAVRRNAVKLKGCRRQSANCCGWPLDSPNLLWVLQWRQRV